MDLIPAKAITRSRNIIIISWVICIFVVGALIFTVLGLSKCEELGCLFALVPAFFAAQAMFLVAPIMMIIISFRMKHNRKLATVVPPEEDQKIFSKNKSLKIFFIVFVVLFFGALYLPASQYISHRQEINKQEKERIEAQARLQEMKQLEKLRNDRLKFLAEDFKKPHKIIRFVNMGEVNFHGPYTKQIGVLLDNNVEVAITATETKQQQDDFLNKLNNFGLQGIEVFAEQVDTITALPDYYNCQNPNFSDNTCEKEILFAGPELYFYSDKKELSRYIYCHLNFSPFSSSGVFDTKQYCSS